MSHMNVLEIEVGQVTLMVFSVYNRMKRISFICKFLLTTINNILYVLIDIINNLFRSKKS